MGVERAGGSPADTPAQAYCVAAGGQSQHLRHAGSSLYDFCRMVQLQFDRFIDLGGEGRRSRSTSDLPTSLDYLSGQRRFTDILVYNTVIT